MELIDDDPPTTRPWFTVITLPSRPGSGSVRKLQSYGPFSSFGARIGTSISRTSSAGPASTSSTDTDGSADRRAAITHPAEPAPTITWSNDVALSPALTRHLRRVQLRPG